MSIEKLKAAATDAKAMAWTPYSNFLVLAAVETIDGRVYGGANVESANFTLTKHAEETAVIAALADGVLQRCGRQWLKTVYVNCGSSAGPCGSCRQFLYEFAADDAVWYGEDNRNGNVLSATLKEMIPHAFGPADLSVAGH